MKFIFLLLFFMPFLTYAGGSDSISVILSDMSLPDSVRIKKAVDFLMKRSAKEKNYVSERFEAVIKFALEKKEEKLSLQAAYMKGVFLFKNEDYGEAMQVLQNTTKMLKKRITPKLKFSRCTCFPKFICTKVIIKSASKFYKKRSIFCKIINIQKFLSH